MSLNSTDSKKCPKALAIAYIIILVQYRYMSHTNIKNPTDCFLSNQDHQKIYITVIFNELILIMGETVGGVLSF